ncbi:MAG: hypothetical protein AVDCRST_MAG55-1420, partial [uncultured Rubrobacteraceae bacterium]
DRPRAAPAAGGDNREPDPHRRLPVFRGLFADRYVFHELPRVHLLDQQGRV